MADLNFTLDADPSRQIAALSRAVAKQEELIKKLREAGRTGRSAGNEIEVAFMKMQSSITRSIGSYLSLGAVVGVASKALADFRNVQNEAGQSLERMRGSLQDLALMARGPEHFKAMQDEIKASVAAGIPEEDATRLSMITARERLDPSDVSYLRGLAPAIKDLAGVADTVAAVREQFGEGAPSFRGTTAGLLAASRMESIPFEDLQSKIAELAFYSEKLGGNFSEVTGAFVSNVDSLGGVRKASFGMKSAFQSLAENLDSITGGEAVGVIGTLDKYAALSKDEKAGLRLSSKDRRVLDVMVRNREAMVGRIAEIEAAVSGADVGQGAAGLAMATEPLGTITRLNQQRARASSITREKLGQTELEFDILREIDDRILSERGIGAFRRFVHKTDDYIARVFGATPAGEFLRSTDFLLGRSDIYAPGRGYSGAELDRLENVARQSFGENTETFQEILKELQRLRGAVQENTAVRGAFGVRLNAGVE